MYQDELSQEAKLIVRGRQAWVRDFAAFWTRFMARFSSGAAKSSAIKDLRLH